MRQYIKQVIKALAFVWVLWFVCLGTAFAGELKDGSQRVFDYAGVFEKEEAARLEEKTAQFRQEMKVEAVVLTVEDANGQSPQYTADQFYFDQGFSESFHENGIVVLIDMDNRELYLGTYGSMIRILTDERIQDILDNMYDAASQGAYGDAAMAGLDGAQYYFKKGIVSNQYNYDVETGEISVHRSIRWYEALFALLVSTAAAAGVCLGVVRQYGMKEDPGVNSRLAYRADCRFQFQNPTDQLLHTAVSHIVIPRQPPRGGGRGFGGGSSGRSSTHSYGGHRAGGGGRKF
ncbi:MAG: TPM domain-containing protein [Lachnospiraceae bacterium]|nr:TPM domain-containing protein [Lachnospiraceae bacterium]